MLERAFNLHPLQSGSPTLIPDSGETGLPAHSLVGPENARRLRVEFIRRKSPPDPGMTYQVLFSDQSATVGSWSPSANPEFVTPINDDWERVTIEDDQAGARRRFARVKIISTE